MQHVTVNLYSDQSNGAVLKLPGRAFPGVLIQGDTLHILIDDLQEVSAAIADRSANEATQALADIIDRLKTIEKRYVTVLGEHGVPVPFV